MPVDRIAIGSEMLIEGHAGMRATQEALQGRFAKLDRRPPQILAVEFKEIERAKRNGMILAPVPDQVEHGQAVHVDRDRFPVDHTRASWQGSDRLDNEREAIGKIVSAAGDQTHAIGVAVGDDAKAVVLDFVNPASSRGRPFGGTRKARLKAPDTARKLTQR